MSRRAFPCWFLLAACAALPCAASAQAARIRIQDEYTWPDLAVLRCSVTQDDLLLVSRVECPAGGAGGSRTGLAAGDEPPLAAMRPASRAGHDEAGLQSRGVLCRERRVR